MLGQAEEWQDLTNAEQRKLDKDEKAVRAEIVKRIKLKYGKAGHSFGGCNLEQPGKKNVRAL